MGIFGRCAVRSAAVSDPNRSESRQHPLQQTSERSVGAKSLQNILTNSLRFFVAPFPFAFPVHGNSFLMTVYFVSSPAPNFAIVLRRYSAGRA